MAERTACFASECTGSLLPHRRLRRTGRQLPRLAALGPNPNPSFGQLTNVPGLDPNYHREYQWQYNLGVQRQLWRNVTVNFTWNRVSDYQQQLLLNYAGTVICLDAVHDSTTRSTGRRSRSITGIPRIMA